MFEVLFKKLFPKVVDATTGAVTGTWPIQLAFYLVKYLPYIVLIGGLCGLGIMNKCERNKTADALAKIDTLNQQVGAQGKEIAELKVSVQVAQKEAEVKTAELGIVKEAMTTQKKLTEQEKVEMDRKKDNLLDKYTAEQDLKKKAEIEAEYWSTIYGIKATVETKGCPTGVKYCVKASTIKPIIAIKPTIPPVVKPIKVVK